MMNFDNLDSESTAASVYSFWFSVSGQRRVLSGSASVLGSALL